MFLNSHGPRQMLWMSYFQYMGIYGKTSSWKVTNRCRFMVGPWRAPLDYSQGCCLSWRLEEFDKDPCREGGGRNTIWHMAGSGWGLFLVRARKWWDFDGEEFSSEYIKILNSGTQILKYWNQYGSRRGSFWCGRENDGILMERGFLLHSTSIS